MDYINTFLKIKSELTGYPKWVRSLEEEERYIERLYENEGVRLYRDATKTNGAKRRLENVCLNSLRVKLTGRKNRTQTKLISDPHEICSFITTPGVEVNLWFTTCSVVWA